MSHFTVLVVTAGGTYAEIETALAPFHEFECTGNVDEYVQTIDVTEDVLEAWAEKTKFYRLADGSIQNFYDRPDSWYRDWTSEEAAAYEANILKPVAERKTLPFEVRQFNGVYKTLQIPEGVELVEGTRQEVEEGAGSNLVDWASEWFGFKVVAQGTSPDLMGEHKYGYITVDANGGFIAAYDRTNPNKKWDWYQIGGRWSQSITIKPGGEGRLGTRSWGSGEVDANPLLVDVARVGDLDWDAMEADVKADREKTIQEVLETIRKAYPDVTDEQADQMRAELVDAYQQAVAEYEAAGKRQLRPNPYPWDRVKQMSDKLADYMDKGLNRTIYDIVGYAISPEFRTFQEYRDAPICALGSYAYLGQDMVWRSRGEMGWFGTSHDDKTQAEWNTQLATALKALPPEAYVALVDCHI